MAEKARDPAISVSSGFSKSTETQGTGDLLRTDDFYETVLAMASHDLRQPLQLIISAQELLARRLTASPEREHLERSERASAQLAEQLDLLVDALHLHQSTGRIRPEPVPSSLFWSASRSSSTGRRGGRECVCVSCRHAPRS
jgi:light-regulated signal transduction histidine kinase (bacteriophytochrome)